MPEPPVGNIVFSKIQVPYSLKQIRAVRSWIHDMIQRENKKPGEIAIYLCSDEHLLEVNRTFLKHDTYTDIITFDYSEGNIVSGEIFVSIDRVRENAKEFNASVRDELHRVLIHGVLHLCGYGDKTPSEKAVMTDKEDFCLSLRSF